MSCLYVRWQLCCFWQLMLWSDGAVKAKAMGAKHGPSGLMMQGFLKRHLIQFNVLCLTVHGLFNHY